MDWLLQPPSSSCGHEISRPAAAAAINTLLALATIAIISYFCAPKAKKALVSEVRIEKITPLPLINSTFQAWDKAYYPAIENLFIELAREIPIRFVAQQLCSFTNNYTTVLGSGGFSKVYKGQFPNGVEIAVKVLHMGHNSNIEEQFMAEARTIMRTRHINLVHLYGYCYDSFMSALVYEFLENGSLDKHLFTENRQLPWEKLHAIAVGTAKGIAYLHEECVQRIIHYDIKPGNVLLDRNFSPKVTDFGLAKLCDRDDAHMSHTGYRGTPGYLAPEFLLRNFPITYKCDVYSFGILLFEIVGQRKNTRASADSNDSLDWFPKNVWDAFDRGDMMELVGACEIMEEKDKVNAESRHVRGRLTGG